MTNTSNDQLSADARQHLIALQEWAARFPRTCTPGRRIVCWRIEYSGGELELSDPVMRELAQAGHIDHIPGDGSMWDIGGYAYNAATLAPQG